MAAVRSRDTKPELIVRKHLHAAGLRFRLNVKELPGKPDLLFPKHHVALFVNGCFFHGHDCHLFKWPKDNAEFWRKKIERNRERDREVIERLSELDWRVATVWECALKGKARLDRQKTMRSLAEWIRLGGKSLVIRGIQDCLPPSPS